RSPSPAFAIPPCDHAAWDPSVGPGTAGGSCPWPSRRPSSQQIEGESMDPASDIVRKLFDDDERGIGTPDPELISDIYEDSFVFAGPQGVQVVRTEDLLRALPRRQAYFQSVGLVTSKVRSLGEARLDDHYLMVKAHWDLPFEKGPGQPLVVETSATYILHRRGDRPRIVLQLDQQDLMERVQELGIALSSE